MNRNDKIINRVVKVVRETGLGEEQSLESAIEEAVEQGLDLVEMSTQSGVSVCKILDYSKYKYQKEKGTVKPTRAVSKEIRLGVNIAKHDITVKSKQAQKFLDKGNTVIVAVVFKGRQTNRQERGEEILRSFKQNLEGYREDKAAKMQGNRYVVELKTEKGAK